MNQQLFNPHLVEVIDNTNQEAIKSFDSVGYWEAWDLVEELQGEYDLDDYSFILTKINN